MVTLYEEGVRLEKNLRRMRYAAFQRDNFMETGFYGTSLLSPPAIEPKAPQAP